MERKKQTISNSTRNLKSSPYEEHDAFNRWIHEYAEAYNMTESEVRELALFRLEDERLKGGANGTKNGLQRKI